MDITTTRNTGHEHVQGAAAARRWIAVCAPDDIVPNTGVCALIDGMQIAVFRVCPADPAYGGDTRYFAIGNYDPNADAAVLSRGLIGSIGNRVVVASPIYKHHFDLSTGECLEAPRHSVAAYAARVDDGRIWIAL